MKCSWAPRLCRSREPLTMHNCKRVGSTCEISDPLEPGNPWNHENTNPIQKRYAGGEPGKYKSNTQKIPAGIHPGRRGKEQIHVQYTKNTRKIQIRTPNTPKIYKKYTFNIPRIPNMNTKGAGA